MTIQNYPWLYEEFGKAKRDPTRGKGVRVEDPIQALGCIGPSAGHLVAK
jgi:hypothetical protein